MRGAVSHQLAWFNNSEQSVRGFVSQYFLFRLHVLVPFYCIMVVLVGYTRVAFSFVCCSRSLLGERERERELMTTWTRAYNKPLHVPTNLRLCLVDLYGVSGAGMYISAKVTNTSLSSQVPRWSNVAALSSEKESSPFYNYNAVEKCTEMEHVGR